MVFLGQGHNWCTSLVSRFKFFRFVASRRLHFSRDVAVMTKFRQSTRNKLCKLKNLGEYYCHRTLQVVKSIAIHESIQFVTRHHHFVCPATNRKFLLGADKIPTCWLLNRPEFCRHLARNALWRKVKRLR